MKYLFFTYRLFLLFSLGMFSNGCIKNNLLHTQTYTITTPVFRTSAEVKANLKNSPSREIRVPGKIVISGKFIFLNETDKGIHFLDNSNPSSPKNITYIDIPGNSDLAVRGNILYADLYSDLITFDISDFENIKLINITANVFPYRNYSTGPDGNGKILYDQFTRDTTIVVQEGQSWQGGQGGVAYLGFSSAPITNGISGSTSKFALAGDYFYTISSSLLNVFNIHADHIPVISKSISIDYRGETIFPLKDKLFVGSQNGMIVYDINTSPESPVKIGTLSHVRACDPVVADNDYAFVTLHSGDKCAGFTNQMDVVQLNHYTDATLFKSYSLTSPRGLSKDGTILFVCDGTAGLKIFDVSDLSNIKLLKSFPGFETYDVIANNKIALVAAKEGLYQYDYNDLKNIHEISRIKTSNKR